MNVRMERAVRQCDFHATVGPALDADDVSREFGNGADVQVVGRPGGPGAAVVDAGEVEVEQVVAGGKVEGEGRGLAQLEADQVPEDAVGVRAPEIRVDVLGRVGEVPGDGVGGGADAPVLADGRVDDLHGERLGEERPVRDGVGERERQRREDVAAQGVEVDGAVVVQGGEGSRVRRNERRVTSAE